ncbi:MAG: M16 family metallopeptidase [bacterium]
MTEVEENINISQTEHNIRVLSEHIPWVHSVSICIAIGSGSSSEDVNISGISHFIEHMLFKGTEKRSAHQIASYLEEVGGYLNAETGKEEALYYAKVGKDYLERAFDLLSDLITNATLRESDIETERGVILREIATYNDLPSENLLDRAVKILFGEDNGYGRPIVGYIDTVRRMKRDNLIWYLSRNYNYENIIVACVGNVNHEKFVALVNEKLENSLRWSGGEITNFEFIPPVVEQIEERNLEQQYICHIWDGLKYSDERRYALFILNAILAGMVSSRLYQRVREELGLVYDISSFPQFMRDAGFFAIMFATNPEAGGKVIQIVREEISKIIKDGISDDELTRAREFIKGGIMLGLESTMNRLLRIIRTELYIGKHISFNETIKRFDSVSKDNIHSLACEIFGKPELICTVGPKVKKLEDLIKDVKGRI